MQFNDSFLQSRDRNGRNILPVKLINYFALLSIVAALYLEQRGIECKVLLIGKNCLFN